MMSRECRFKLYISGVLLVVVIMSGCTSVTSDQPQNNPDVNGNTSEWLIPKSQVYDGGPGRDGIPSIDNPQFSKASEIDFLDDNELVIGIKIDGEIKAYPHVILYYHEIVNDSVGETPIALTFCPLTGSGIAWGRTINGDTTMFGVSGLIHKNNLMPFDRTTNSTWSQMENVSVNGDLIRTEPDLYQVVEMTWGAWEKAFPESKVLNTNTGFSRDYDKYLYGRDYPENNSRIIFPIENTDERLERKTLVHGIFTEFPTAVFPIDDFPAEITVANLTQNSTPVVVAGSSDRKFAVSFLRELDGTVLKFTSSNTEFPIVLESEDNTKWNIFGEAVGGPRKGAKLKNTKSYNAYWFAWADFYPHGPTIHTF